MTTANHHPEIAEPLARAALPVLAAPTAADRLAAVREKRRALKAQLETQASADADERALAAEELAYADEQAIAAAAIKYGPIGVKIDTVPTRLGVIVVKRAAESAFKEFSELEALSFDALDAYARKAIVHPPIAQYDLLVRELPGTLPDLVLAINKLMGQRFKETAKK